MLSDISVREVIPSYYVPRLSSDTIVALVSTIASSSSITRLSGDNIPAIAKARRRTIRILAQQDSVVEQMASYLGLLLMLLFLREIPLEHGVDR